MARLDRLGPAKEVAQIGAAIGREFSHALLAAVARKPEAELASALDRLIAAGLLFRQGVPPHASYLFKHALVQDAAYGTLLREPRRALHARIAETLESQFAEIAENQPELLARHCTEAGLIEKAAGLWGKAGQRSLERSALVEAVEQLTRALDQIATLPATPALRREQIKLQVALITSAHPCQRVCGAGNQGGCGAGTSADRTSRSARRASRRPAAVVLGPLRLLGRELSGVQRRCDARACGAVPGARREARGDSSAHDRASPHGQFLAVYGRHRGRPSASTIEAIALYDPAEHRPLATRFGARRQGGNLVLSVVGLVVAWLSRGRARGRRPRAQGCARDRPSCHFDVCACFTTSASASLCGNYAAANAHVDELVALADEKGALLWKAFGMLQQGCLLALTGKAADAVQMITSGIMPHGGQREQQCGCRRGLSYLASSPCGTWPIR